MSLAIYELWQAERPKTKQEQREIDRVMGQIAEALTHRWHAPGPVRAAVPAQRGGPARTGPAAPRATPAGTIREA